MVGFFVLVIGLIMAVWPYAAWYVSVGWQFKDASPSELALTIQRIVGIVFVIVGFVIMISSCSIGGNARSEWPDTFKEKLSAGEVQKITIGFVSPVSLTQEETYTIINILKNAELKPFDPDTSYATVEEGKIVFKDATTVELVFGSTSTGGNELHGPSGEYYK
ncbi:DUF6199 family natural product biosynthesis protein [Paenibacillus montanisoli]|uniref:DUF6199 domain-containing protein n=1 Tax=Paenibacillus montanisoli TaxID=2081970 RepID=A0A328TUZ6_9BACL|nr:DUF6199 family natural product biosynthesis protein [Paenibacillus montanisoli]RAP74347.1 hypothetical protein DL346_19885 [Paenibacillus montanisoli]